MNPQGERDSYACILTWRSITAQSFVTAPLYLWRDRRMKNRRRNSKSKIKDSKRRKGGGTPHLHQVPGRQSPAIVVQWNNALFLLGSSFCGESQGINKIVSRCWEARACGSKVIDVGWHTHPDFPTSHNGSQSIRGGRLQCGAVKP